MLRRNLLAVAILVMGALIATFYFRPSPSIPLIVIVLILAFLYGHPQIVRSAWDRASHFAASRKTHDSPNQPHPSSELVANSSVPRPPTAPASREERKPVSKVPLVYTIKLPKDTRWEPEKAIVLISQFAPFDRLVLRLKATSEGIVWQVIDFNKQPFEPSAVAKAIHSAYIEAEVSEPQPLQLFPVKKPIWRLNAFFGQTQDFVGSIATARDISKGDPLAVIANTLSNLEPGEEVSYLVSLREVDQRAVWRDADNLLHVPRWKNWSLTEVIGVFVGFATIVGSVFSILYIPYKFFVAGRRDVYVKEDMKVFYDKLNDVPLSRVAIAVEINTPVRERIGHFELAPALLQYNTVYQKLGYIVEPELVQITSDEENNRTSIFNRFIELSGKPRDKRIGILSPSELAGLWHLPHEGMTSPDIVWSRGRQIAAPAEFRGKRPGVFMGVNRPPGSQSYEIYQPAGERTTHTLVIGKTGVGKTSFMQALVAQDIEAGRGVAVVDPLGRFVRRILQHHIPVEREDDVVILDIDYEFDEDGEKVRYPPPLNLLSRPVGLDEGIAAGKTVSVLTKIYGDGFEASNMASTLTNALITLAHEKTPTLLDIENVITDLEYRNRLLEGVDNLAVSRFWERFDRQAGQQQSSLFAALRRLDPFYSNPLLAAITCHPDPLDIARLISQNKIILVSIHADEQKVPELERNILGATVVSQIQMAALAGAVRDPQYPYMLYVDEVQEFVTTSLDEIARQARQKGLGLVVATQYLKSLAGKTLDAFLGTVGTITAFECDERDAKIVLSQMNPFEVSQLTGLGKYRAAVSMRPAEGTSRAAFSLEPVSGPDISNHPDLMARELYLRQKSVKNYTPKSHREVSQWLKNRYASPGKQAAKPKPDESTSSSFSDPL